MAGEGPAGAVAALSAALGADPGRGDLWSELATALVAAGRAHEAWDAAARAVEVAPGSAASHRAIGTVAAALGDPAQAESAYRHALLLDPTDHAARTALAHLPTPPRPGRRRAAEAGAASWGGAAAVPAPRPNGSRHAAPEDEEARAVPGAWAEPMPAGATQAADPEAWHRALVTVVRIEWLVGVVCFVGLGYGRTAPYTAGLLAGALVVAGGYAGPRWRQARTRRPPEPDRIPTYAAVAAVPTAVVIIPAAMFGAVTLARVAAVAAVTCATVAAVLLARAVGKGIWP